MRVKTEITEEDFSRLLAWLAADPDAAAKKYEELRAGLIRFFTYRGCEEPETLADETLNRVAVKTATVEFDGRVKLSTYFYAFASRILLEHVRERKKIRARAERIADEYRRGAAAAGARRDAGGPCLGKCLGAHPPHDRRLLLGYYADDGESRAAHRKRLAAREGMSIENLHTRVSRLRAAVGRCLRECLGAPGS